MALLLSERGESFSEIILKPTLCPQLSLSLSLWLSRCPCLFTSCRCWNKLALVRGATVAASVIEYLFTGCLNDFWDFWV